MDQRKRRKELDMLHGPLAGKLLQFALPLALTGILQQLFNAADVAVVGRFCGNNAMAAVGSNTPIVGLMVNLFVGVALGANVVIAQYTGQGDGKKVTQTVHNSILIALVCGVILTLIGELCAPALLKRLSVPDEVLPYSILYLRIYMAGMPVILLYNFLSAIFRSRGDTRTPLICLTTGGVINVGLNLFFVLVLGRSVDGVAIATVASNLVSSIMLYLVLASGKGPVRLDWHGFRPDFQIIGRIFRIGVPAGLQGMVFSISNIAIQSAINSLGALVMAASSAAFNVEIFAYFILNSFGQASTTFVGQNYGANQMDRCFRVTRTCLWMDMAAAILASGVLLLLSVPVLRIFNGDPGVVAYGRMRLFPVLLGEPLSVIMEILSGSLRGYGKSMPPAVMTMVGVVGVRMFWVYLIFPLSRSFLTLMLCYPISWAVTALAIAVYYFRYKKTLRTYTEA